MIKRITNKLKSIFGQKPKTKVVSKTESVKETKQSSQQFKQHPSRKSNPAHSKRKPIKKETPEEYKQRHQKKAQTKVIKVKQSSDTKPWDDSVFDIPLVEGKTRFHDLGLPKEILHAVYDLTFQYCTQVQSETLPKALKGEDVTAQAQTGTGKTAAFLITIFSHILKNPLEKKRSNGTPRALILAPTRELVLQIEKDAERTPAIRFFFFFFFRVFMSSYS